MKVTYPERDVSFPQCFNCTFKDMKEHIYINENVVPYVLIVPLRI